jgi:hypothetical protein
MSLLTPAPFNNDNENENENENLISKKKASHNRTQKRYPKEGFDSAKVNNLLKTIHGGDEDDGDGEGSHLADFNPPPKPSSIGSERAALNRDKARMENHIKHQEGLQNYGSSIPSLGNQPTPFLGNKNDEDLTLNNFNQNYGDQTSVEEYYKKYIPNYVKGQAQQQNQQHQQQNYSSHSAYYNQPVLTGFGSSDDLLLQKLNYMIHLLEEKQDERTNNVTEEVVLYSFLGIFIIFIVDSFSRVGKYVR